MGSLVEQYQSRLKVLNRDLEITQDKYKNAVKSYLLSEDSWPSMKNLIVRLFFPTVIYLSNTGHTVSFVGEYDAGFNWSEEELKKIFGEYKEPIAHAISYIVDGELSTSFDDYFLLTICVGNGPPYIELVAEHMEPLDDRYEYENQCIITDFGEAARNNFIKFIKANMKDVLYEALNEDSEVLHLISCDTKFCNYFFDKYNLSLRDMGTRKLSEAMPKHLNTKEYNLWDIYAEFISNA